MHGRDFCTLEISVVTGGAVGRRGFHIPSFMAGGTIRSYGRMGARERIDGIMIKGTGFPARICAVAARTIFRESGQCVIRIFGTLEISGVTGGAVGRRGFHIPSFMAGGTIRSHGCMCTRERIDGIMIKGTGFPARICAVARGTIFRESGYYVIWIFGALEIGRVAGGTFFRRIFSAGICMAFGTIIRHCRMSAGEWIKLIMVKGAWTPTWRGGMTGHTIRR